LLQEPARCWRVASLPSDYDRFPVWGGGGGNRFFLIDVVAKKQIKTLTDSLFFRLLLFYGLIGLVVTLLSYLDWACYNLSSRLF
jgi:hypothetical protein